MKIEILKGRMRFAYWLSGIFFTAILCLEIVNYSYCNGHIAQDGFPAIYYEWIDVGPQDIHPFKFRLFIFDQILAIPLPALLLYFFKRRKIAIFNFSLKPFMLIACGIVLVFMINPLTHLLEYTEPFFMIICLTIGGIISKWLGVMFFLTIITGIVYTLKLIYLRKILNK